MIDEDDLKDIPPHARAAIIAALNAVEEDRDPKEDYRLLMRLGALLTGGIMPSPATIISAVAASVSLLRWVDKKRKRRNRRRARRGQKAGLAAYRASKLAGRK